MEYLEPFDGPVVEGLEQREVVLAKNQKQYKPLRVLIGPYPEHRVTSRWTFTPEQRRLVEQGADLYLSLMTFGSLPQPVLVGVE